jgi:LPXTG-motif cell wall-anchored protein
VISKFCLLGCLFFLSLFWSVSTTNAAVFYLKPLGGNMAKGVVFPVQLRMSAQGESITSLSVYLDYPSDKLGVAYIKPSSNFPVSLGTTTGNNTFGLTRENINGVTGDVLIATVGFKPKISNSTVMISFIDGSRASLSDNTNVLDLDWSKARVGKYNIAEGASGVAASSNGVKQLPNSGLSSSTNILLGAGLGLTSLGSFGLFAYRKRRLPI